MKKYNNSFVVRYLNDTVGELMSIDAYLHEQQQYETESLISEALDKISTACNKIFEKDNNGLVDAVKTMNKHFKEE